MPYRDMRIRLLPTAAALLAALAAAAGGLAVSGCGSSGSTLDPLASAAEVTSHAGGAHLTLSARIASGALPSAITMSGSGFFNYHSHEGKISMTLAGLPANAVTGSSLG